MVGGGELFSAAAPPAADVLRVALLQKRHRECLRILIIIACLASFRRGRAAISFTVCKAASPLSFLLWFIGLRKRRDRNDNNSSLLHGTNGSDNNNAPPLIRGRGGWRDTFRISYRSGDSARGGGGGGMPDEQRGGLGSRSTRVAMLGERGMRSVFDQFRQLQRDGACCDVTLTVGDRAFKAHKCVLAAQSSPLRAMFEGSFKEGNENVIALLGVEPSSFSLLLDFLYGNSIDVNDENAEALLDLSARYGVSLLRRHCCAFMAGSANPSKACSLLAVADRYDCHRLRRQLLAYTLECFPLVCSDSDSEGFRHLSPALVAEVLQDDGLVSGERGEVTVFWAAISWLEAERSRRRRADEVLSHVRFGLVSAKTLAESVESHPFMQSNVGKAFVHEAYRYQALPSESRGDFASSMSARARPRTSTTTDTDAAAAAAAAALGGGGGGGRVGRFSTAVLRPSSAVGLAGGLRAVGFVDEEGGCSSSDDSEVEREGDRDIELEESGSRRAAAGGESGGVRNVGGVGGADDDEDGARAAPASGSTEQISGGEIPGSEGGGGVGNESSSKSHTGDASPSRSLWGAGLRMYV